MKNNYQINGCATSTTLLKGIAIITLLLHSNFELKSQCYMDRHATNWFDSWISCEVAPNPNPDYEDGHWLLYDLKSEHTLYNSRIWNHNDPLNLEMGIKKMKVDYSSDGTAWQNLGNFDLSVASGDPLYEGKVGPDFGEVVARYILLTVQETWGNDCAALAEWSIQAESNEISTSTEFIAYQENPCFSIKLYPNPVRDLGKVIFESVCAESVHMEILDLLGRQVYQKSFSPNPHQIIEWDSKDWSEGAYVMFVQQNGVTSSLPFIKS